MIESSRPSHQSNSAVLDRLIDKAFAPLAQAIARGAIPGAALGVVRKDGIRATYFDGLAQSEPVRRILRPEHFFDLASLTKVLVTLPLMLEVRRRGWIDFDTPLATVLPELCQVNPTAPVRSLTPISLLSHRAGLANWHPLYLAASDPESIKALILQMNWPVGPSVYSDIGFILLGVMLERLFGRPFERLRLPPGFTFRPPPYRSVATEACPWRKRVICGEVHDENAFALGGAAGHAGAFATLDATLDCALAHLRGEVMNAEEAALVLEPRSIDRGLAWQLPHPGWIGGPAASPNSIGHTGFTGTSMVIDFDRELAWVLLTNRVHPSRHTQTGIGDLRIAVADQILSSVSA